jgi:hypothetical protein
MTPRSHQTARVDQEILALIHDPATSAWAREALRDGMRRDPVDAANEAEVIATLLLRRLEAVAADADAAAAKL